MPPTTPPEQKISALFKGLDGQNLDLTDLPPEHEIHLIDEAREYYTSEPPIFLADTRNKPKSTVNKACLALEGHSGALGGRVSVTTRAWCNRNVYQTIDLNKQRIIVKLFKGGPRGVFYRRWMGVIAGFEKQPIAFAVSEVREAREGNQVGRASLSGGMRGQDLVTSDAKPATKRKRKSIPSRVNESDSSEAEFVPQKKSAHTNSLRQKRLIELEKSPNATTNRSPQIDQPLDLAPAAMMNPPKSRPSLPRASAASSTAALQLKIKKEAGTSEPRIRFPAPSKTPSVPLVQPANTSSVRSQAQSSNNNISSRPAPPSSGDNSSRGIPQPNQPSATSSSSKAAATPAHPPNSNDEYEELVSNFLSSPLVPTATTTSITNLPQPEAASSSSAPILSPQKQAATILSVYLNQDEDYVPLYLRSCMTISRLFASCLGAFELVDRPELVSALRVRLDHNTTTSGLVVNEVGTRQEVCWLVKRAVPDSFDIFLEAVNKWAGWKDRDTCDVRVDIILRARK